MHIIRVAEPIYHHQHSDTSTSTSSSTLPRKRVIPRHTNGDSTENTSSVPSRPSRPFSALVSSTTSSPAPLPISLLPYHRAFQPDAWRTALNTPHEDRISGKHIITSIYTLLWLKSSHSILGYNKSRHEIRKIRDLIRRKSIASLAGVNIRILNETLPEYSEESDFQLAHSLHLPNTIIYTNDCSAVKKEEEMIWIKDMEVVYIALRSDNPPSILSTPIHPSAWYFSTSSSTSQSEILRKNHTHTKEEHARMLKKVFLKEKGRKEKTVEEVGREDREEKRREKSPTRMKLRPASALPSSSSSSSSTSRTKTVSLPGKFISIGKDSIMKSRPTSATSKSSSAPNNTNHKLDIVAQFIALNPDSAPTITYLEGSDMEVFVRNLMKGKMTINDSATPSKRIRPSTASSTSYSLTSTQQQQHQDRLRQELYANLYNDMDILVSPDALHNDPLVAVPGTRLRKRKKDVANQIDGSSDDITSSSTYSKQPIGILQEYSCSSSSSSSEDSHSSLYHIEWYEEECLEYIHALRDIENRKREITQLKKKMKYKNIEFSHELLLLQSNLTTRQSTLEEMNKTQSYCKITMMRNENTLCTVESDDDGHMRKKKSRYQIVYEKVCCTEYGITSSSSSPPPISHSSLLPGSILHTRFSYLLQMISYHIQSVSNENLKPWRMSILFSVDSCGSSTGNGVKSDIKMRWCDQLIYWHEKEMVVGEGPERVKLRSGEEEEDVEGDEEEMDTTRFVEEEKEEIQMSVDPLDIINRDSSLPTITITQHLQSSPSPPLTNQLEHSNSINNDVKKAASESDSTASQHISTIESQPSHESSSSWAYQIEIELKQRREEEQKMYEEYGKGERKENGDGIGNGDSKSITQRVEVVNSARSKDLLLAPNSARITQRTNVNQHLTSSQQHQQQPSSSCSTQRSITSPATTSRDTRAMSHRSSQDTTTQSSSTVPTPSATLQQSSVKSSWELKIGENIANKAIPQSRGFLNSSSTKSAAAAAAAAGGRVAVNNIQPYRMKQIELLAPQSEHHRSNSNNSNKVGKLRDSPSQIDTPPSNCSSLSALSSTILTSNQRGMSQNSSQSSLTKQKRMEEDHTFLTSTPLSPRSMATRQHVPQLAMNGGVTSSPSSFTSNNSTYFTCPHCRLSLQIHSIYSVTISEIIEEYMRMKSFIKDNEIQVKQEMMMKKMKNQNTSNHHSFNHLSHYLTSSSSSSSIPPTLSYIFPTLTLIEYNSKYLNDEEFRNSRIDICQDCEGVVRGANGSERSKNDDNDDEESTHHATTNRLFEHLNPSPPPLPLTASSIVPYDLHQFNESTITMLSNIALSDSEKHEMDKKFEERMKERKEEEEEVMRIRKRYTKKREDGGDAKGDHLSHLIGVTPSTISYPLRASSSLSHSSNPFMPPRSIKTKLDEPPLPAASLRARENRRRIEREKREKELETPSTLLSRYDPDLISSLGGAIVTPAPDAELVQKHERRVEAEKAVHEIVQRSERERNYMKAEEEKDRMESTHQKKTPTSTFTTASSFAPLHSQLHQLAQRPTTRGNDSLAIALEYQKIIKPLSQRRSSKPNRD